MDVGITGLYGITPDEYYADPDGMIARFSPSFEEASPISHLSADDDVLIRMTYDLEPGSGNIHGSEFGTYLASGQPASLATTYGRTSLDAVGIDYELAVGGGLIANQKSLYQFILDQCF